MSKHIITAIIDDMFAGAYGSDHEFEAKYDVWQKNEILSSILFKWPNPNNEEKQLIAEAIRSHIGYYWCNFDPITDWIVFNVTQLNVLVEITGEFLNSGIFSLSLLNSIEKVKDKIPECIVEEWIKIIEENEKNKSFKETYFDTDIDKLYSQIKQAIQL